MRWHQASWRPEGAQPLAFPGGTLIYAADEGVRHAEHVVVRAGKRLRVVALDLAAPPKGIRQQMALIVGAVKAAATHVVAGAASLPSPRSAMPALGAAP